MNICLPMNMYALYCPVFIYPNKRKNYFGTNFSHFIITPSHRAVYNTENYEIFSNIDNFKQYL